MQKKMQPELAELKKKYKNDQEKLHKATMELWQKHGMNPFSQLGGCLLLFMQMPIFMGLYRALQVDIELRDAPLISSAVRWCSNLAAPDMLFDWSNFMPNAVNNGIGFPWLPLLGPMLGLGPYLDLFPIITIGLFIIQQKVMMPPAADEQAEATQKMMKYMMIVMGLMLLQGGGWVMHLLHRLDALGSGRKATPAQAGDGRRKRGRGAAQQIEAAAPPYRLRASSHSPAKEEEVARYTLRLSLFASRSRAKLASRGARCAWIRLKPLRSARDCRMAASNCPSVCAS